MRTPGQMAAITRMEAQQWVSRLEVTRRAREKAETLPTMTSIYRRSAPRRYAPPST